MLYIKQATCLPPMLWDTHTRGLSPIPAALSLSSSSLLLKAIDFLQTKTNTGKMEHDRLKGNVKTQLILVLYVYESELGKQILII